MKTLPSLSFLISASNSIRYYSRLVLIPNQNHLLPLSMTLSFLDYTLHLLFFDVTRFHPFRFQLYYLSTFPHSVSCLFRLFARSSISLSLALSISSVLLHFLLLFRNLLSFTPFLDSTRASLALQVLLSHGQTNGFPNCDLEPPPMSLTIQPNPLITRPFKPLLSLQFPPHLILIQHPIQIPVCPRQVATLYGE